MKQRFAVMFTILAFGLCVAPALAQSGSVKGTCKDVAGKPVAGAIVEWQNMDNGSKYDLKTNNKGEYFSLGVASGKYKVTLLQGGKELFHVNGFNVVSDENTLDFDLQKEQQNAAKGQGLTPEQLKQQQEQQAKQQKEVNTVKTLNEKLAAAKQQSDAGDFDSAVATLTEAAQIDPNRDLIWFKLADAYRSSANKQTDAAEKTKPWT